MDELDHQTTGADQPDLREAEGDGSEAVELLLHALGACLTARIEADVHERGVRLRALTSTLTGVIDVGGMPGVDGAGRRGLDQIRVDVAIDADATPYELRAIVAGAVRRSAVFDTLRRGVDITTHVNSPEGR